MGRDDGAADNGEGALPRGLHEVAVAHRRVPGDEVRHGRVVPRVAQPAVLRQDRIEEDAAQQVGERAIGAGPDYPVDEQPEHCRRVLARGAAAGDELRRLDRAVRAELRLDDRARQRADRRLRLQLRLRQLLERQRRAQQIRQRPVREDERDHGPGAAGHGGDVFDLRQPAVAVQPPELPDGGGSGARPAARRRRCRSPGGRPRRHLRERHRGPRSSRPPGRSTRTGPSAFARCGGRRQRRQRGTDGRRHQHHPPPNRSS